MKAIFKKRLLKLAGVLEKLPKDRFYYGTWAGEDWKGKPDLSCGTTACAFGWATTVPSFREMGLRLKSTEDGYADSYVGLKGSKKISNEASIQAAEKIFGLNKESFYYLFIPDLYTNSLGYGATAKQVAKHIRKFVAKQ